ncbi:MAG: DUF917 domain-containing protein, partial [Rhodospirillaceae bacterium]|nr:DUF917 domain-containing protein [Rhodospirillaceae bacterium]
MPPVADRARLSLEVKDLADFVRGAAFMGAGGGGDPYIGYLLLQQQLRESGGVRIISPAKIDDDDFVVPVGCMGAPTVMTEKIPSIGALETALDTLERLVERRVNAIIPLEIGGINSTVPLVLAARRGLPAVNGDGMGRAFPEIQMVTFGVYGCPISPVVVTNEADDIVIVQSRDNKQGEDLARSVVTQMGGMAQISLYPMSGADVRRTCVPDTLTLALDIGRAIGGASASGQDPFASLFETLDRCEPARDYRVLFDGKVVDVRRETRSGFNVGVVSLSGLNGDNDRFEVHFQNENTVAYRDGRTVAVVPDIISILDRDTAEPITAEQVRYGQRVKVLGGRVGGGIAAPRPSQTRAC